MGNSKADILVLGIESSCDETAASVVAADGRILSNVVLSQLDEHRPYGGVVPEIAARAHIDHLDGLIARAMDEAGIGFDALSAVAATAGPGLIGGVMVGLMTGKAIAAARGLPFIGVNHLEGHALSVRLAAPLPRSEESRAGQEGVRTVRSWWSPEYKKKKQQTIKRLQQNPRTERN